MAYLIMMYANNTCQMLNWQHQRLQVVAVLLAAP